MQTLVITAWNPVYGAPADLNFGKALSQVPLSVYRSLYADETAERAGWVVPALHPLESWGDARAHDGTVTFQQPLISPLYMGAAEVELLSAFLGEGDKSAYTLLRESWKATAPDASNGIAASSSARMRSGTGSDSRTPSSAACGSARVMTRCGPPAS